MIFLLSIIKIVLVHVSILCDLHKLQARCKDVCIHYDHYDYIFVVHDFHI